jgi:sec-independent protein translocase protein TatB
VDSDLNSTWSEVTGTGENSLLNPLLAPPTTGQLALKAKDFRKKKLARNSAVPSWYKQKTGHKTRVISGAARVAKYRPFNSGKSAFSFH